MATIAGERRTPAPSPCAARTRNKEPARSVLLFRELAPEGFGRLLSCAVLGYFGGPFSFRGACISRKAGFLPTPDFKFKFASAAPGGRGASAGGF